MKRSLVVALVLVSGCYLEPVGGPPPPMGPQPRGGFGPVAQGGPPPGGTVAAGGVIEAGCSFNGGQLQGDVGAVFQVACPANCESSGTVWGTDIYTADSGLCRAGIHAGLISPGGGMMVVRLEPGQPAYRGTVRNGVQSVDYGRYGKSYVLFPAGGAAAAAPPSQYPPPSQQQYAPPPPAQVPPPGPQPAGYATVRPAGPVIEAGCSFSANQIRGEIGTSHLVNCPPGCGKGSVWGTDVYTADSSVCHAAVHSGLATDAAGGTFVVTIDPGRPAYRGSVRNGIHGSDYGSYAKSFHVSRP